MSSADLVIASWNTVKGIDNYQEVAGVLLFRR